MENIISVANVGKTYARGGQSVEVLRNINLEIAEGDFVALMGPSGSGKTTLLNLLGGLDEPTVGDILFKGERVSSMTAGQLADWRSRHIGFVFQFYNLMPTLTALKNVELPLLLSNLKAEQRRKSAQIALHLVGLETRANHKPSELSGGQQQRVAIARAIASDPDILICDEPTGDLDRSAAEEVMALLASLNREHGKTIVMVTHDPKAAQHARRIINLDKGTLAVTQEKPVLAGEDPRRFAAEAHA